MNTFLELIEISNKIISVTEKTTSCWKTGVWLYGEEKLTDAATQRECSERLLITTAVLH
jgi:hypothetical protein